MNTYKSPYLDVNIPTDRSVSQILEEFNPDLIRHDKVILEDFGAPHKSITYGGIRAAAAQGAAGLKGVLGMREGDMAAVLSSNSVDWAILGHSIWWLGGIICAINPSSTAYELVHYLAIAKAKFIFLEEDVLAKVEEALKLGGGSITKPTIVVLGNDFAGDAYRVFPRDILDGTKVQTPPFNLSNSDNRKRAAVICFSSGTSGKPKAVVLSHYNIIGYLVCMRQTDPFLYNGFQREVFYAPFSHLYGMMMAFVLPAFSGRYVVVMNKFELQPYIERCAEIKATVLCVVPSTAVELVKAPFVRGLDLTSVQTILCGGAPLQVGVVQQLQELMGDTNIVQGYGLSEGGVTNLRGHASKWKAGSVGRLFAGHQARIVDGDGKDVTAGQPGQIIIKGPTVFIYGGVVSLTTRDREYKDNPEATKAAFKDGWFCSGDIGRMDSDGFLWLTGRKKELIKYKGLQVSPAELEDVLLSHPDVKEAALCGVFDAQRQTEVPVAYVSLQKREATSNQAEMGGILQGIRKYVDGRVSSHKQLRGGVHYLAEIPKNANGKLMRRLLPAKLAEVGKENRISKL
ncbi:acyl-CoA synthetases/AMP-acid ligases II [Microsporum canis CBS 113480]|uniref:Acyl-CoA synthetases/AMP-acid ligases II n=1 Tax=Arthroderma otae (strain ATCC MYA-4605 / CBS 113480) TaxID=554155 RepID=C5FZS5_ARTOC|nr:acyl-CoA synthetases/AMP-acid ligases II [Microsporum canis CBS 113480]EEQ35378.1 acyl-CoA synthetases/AMP-acid ligases II [Microsporum canis CBS 113480]